MAISIAPSKTITIPNPPVNSLTDNELVALFDKAMDLFIRAYNLRIDTHQEFTDYCRELKAEVIARKLQGMSVAFSGPEAAGASR